MRLLVIIGVKLFVLLVLRLRFGGLFVICWLLVFSLLFLLWF